MKFATKQLSFTNLYIIFELFLCNISNKSVNNCNDITNMVQTLDNAMSSTYVIKSECLHSSVLRLCVLESYVPLRNATKRERLRF